jgi:superfamily II DNA helicase RecQ
MSPKVDVLAISREVSKALLPVLITTLKDEIKNSVIMQTRIHFPALRPIYKQHELRPVTDVRIPSSRLADFRRFMGDGENFKAKEQAVLFDAMATNEHNILAVIRCGLGKTEVAIAATTLYGGRKFTLFVVPVSGLVNDFCFRLHKRGVAYSRWRADGAFNENVAIIWVPVENLDFEPFHESVLFRLDVPPLTEVFLTVG